MAQLRSRNRATSHKNRRSPIRYGFLAGIEALRFSELAALKDYKRELSEKQMPNTAVIIFISLYLIFVPGSSLFFWGGGGGWGSNGRGGGKRTSQGRPGG